jgi:DNA-binding XRE family transcriptional regulator
VELAKRAGVNHTTIVHAETGKKQPQLATIIKIVEVLDEELAKQGSGVDLENLDDILTNDLYYKTALNNGVYLLRIKSGLTIRELAKRAGVTTVTVYQAETGRVRTYNDTLIKLVQVLNDELTNQVNLLTAQKSSSKDFSPGQLNSSHFRDSSTPHFQTLHIHL